MRALILAVVVALLPRVGAAAKLTDDERLEIIRGMTAEFATLKSLLPRSKKPLPYNSDGTWDKQKWDEAAKQMGPAGRMGDLIQITKVAIEGDRILLEINGGLKTGPKWYERIEVGMGTSTTPVSGRIDPKLGSNIALLFPKGVPPLSASDIKKMLLPLMDFDKRSATEQYVQTLPPEVQKAVAEGRVLEGMDRDTVILAMGGRPRLKSRETRDGIDYEDWVYGNPPGKIVFVTFSGSKVTKVKETYAGLGGSTVPSLPPR
ncbi:MAG: hypothetical protein IANPNBLG_04167 [Bryobacteraceae bacterium]|nr:hypothetical protein [Bryobacteraceae bacterium]